MDRFFLRVFVFPLATVLCVFPFFTNTFFPPFTFRGGLGPSFGFCSWGVFIFLFRLVLFFPFPIFPFNFRFFCPPRCSLLLVRRVEF